MGSVRESLSSLYIIVAEKLSYTASKTADAFTFALSIISESMSYLASKLGTFVGLNAFSVNSHFTISEELSAVCEHIKIDEVDVAVLELFEEIDAMDDSEDNVLLDMDGSLMQIIQNGTLEELQQKMLNADQDTFMTRSNDLSRDTALHRAAFLHKHEMVKWLLEQPIDRDTKNAQGLTAYELAVRARSLKCAELLRMS